MSLETLAEGANLHWTYLSGIENGKRNPSWVVVSKLAGALGVDICELERLAAKQPGPDAKS